MSKQQTSGPVLGVMVTPRAVHAMLVEQRDGGLNVLRRFTRQRTASAVEAKAPSTTQAAMPGLEEGNDFTLQFGDGGGGGASGEYFLNSEFNLNGLNGDAEATAAPETFALELSDILAECRDAGYARPRVAFCEGARTVEPVELLLPDVEAEAGREVSRRKLLARLEDQQQEDVDAERTAFVALTPDEEGKCRYLALLARPTEPVVPTLEDLRKNHRRLSPRLQFLETEVSLYLGLARATFQDEIGLAQSAGEKTGTLVVRTGEEDTLVLFVEDDRLFHTEVLRSLTSHDAPETVCSRILLLQDEYGIGEIDHVLLLDGNGGDDLVESFEMFFPSSRIESMHRCVAERVGADEPMEAALVPAAVAALRVAEPERLAPFFEDVNLLPKRLLRRKVEMPITWPSIAMLALLFVTALFFVWRFVSYEQQIDETQMQLRAYTTAPMEHDPRVLQARIDSLQQTATSIAHALEVMDKLLVGSDRWSRTMEQTARQVASIRGIWIDRWLPSGNQLMLSGNATSRDRVVQLAEAIGADIESLKFNEIREWPVYLFTMKMQIEEELPAATRYLRARAAETVRETPPDVPTTAASYDQ